MCGCTFERAGKRITPHSLQTGIVFCTSKCWYEYKRSISPPLLEVTCVVCGKGFQRSKRQCAAGVGHEPHCSRECVGVANGKRRASSKPTNEEVIEKFWSLVNKTPGLGPEGDCWEWLGSKNGGGYGTISWTQRKNETGVKGHTFQAHRIAFELASGPIPQGQGVLHSCDNRACVNPAHLRAGTALDNIHDALGRDRFPVGGRASNAKLTDLEVREIKLMLLAGFSHPYLAELYGYTVKGISAISRGMNWKHILVNASDLESRPDIWDVFRNNLSTDNRRMYSKQVRIMYNLNSRSREKNANH